MDPYSKQAIELRKTIAGKAVGIINNTLKSVGLRGFSVNRESAGPEWFEIVKEGVHEITLYFDQRRADSKRRLRLNVCAMGSFDSDSIEKVEYYIAVGIIAKHLSYLENELNGIPEFKEYDK